jgi:hypothetical protein
MVLHTVFLKRVVVFLNGTKGEDAETEERELLCKVTGGTSAVCRKVKAKAIPVTGREGP